MEVITTLREVRSQVKKASWWFVLDFLAQVHLLWCTVCKKRRVTKLETFFFHFYWLYPEFFDAFLHVRLQLSHGARVDQQARARNLLVRWTLFDFQALLSSQTCLWKRLKLKEIGNFAFLIPVNRITEMITIRDFFTNPMTIQ